MVPSPASSHLPATASRDDPDDRQPPARRRFGLIERHALAERLAVREVAAGQAFADDGDAGRLPIVGGAEVAAAHERQPHRREVAGQDDAIDAAGPIVLRRPRPAVDVEAERPDVADQRRMVDGAGRLDAGQGAQPLDRGGEERGAPARVGLGGALYRHRHRQHAARVEARIDRRRRGEAAQHEAGADQQDERQRQLRDDEHVAQQRLAADARSCRGRRGDRRCASAPPATPAPGRRRGR